MSYHVVIKKQAEKKLKNMPAYLRNLIAEKIYMLSQNPTDPRLEVKKLVGEPFYRMRVGDWRVIFDKQEKIKVISIEKIKPRGDVYK